MCTPQWCYIHFNIDPCFITPLHHALSVSSQCLSEMWVSSFAVKMYRCIVQLPIQNINFKAYLFTHAPPFQNNTKDLLCLNPPKQGKHRVRKTLASAFSSKIFFFTLCIVCVTFQRSLKIPFLFLTASFYSIWKTLILLPPVILMQHK